MKEQCFDEGTIQAFLDGELASGLLEKVARHTASCESCAALLQETEAESTFAFAALDNEFNALVPTERIRSNVYQAISEIEKPKTSIWQKFLSLGKILSSPSVAAFASLLMIAGVVVTLWSLKNQPVSNDVAEKTTKENSSELIKETTPVISNSVNTASVDKQSVKPLEEQIAYKPKAAVQPKIQNAVYRISDPDNNVQRTKFGTVKTAVQPAEAISGEGVYIKTIATLTETVNGQKDQVLKPSARIDFERNLAIADDSIAKMRKEVKKDPKNEAAKQVLRNSYQNKIDLLNSVNDKSELMATLK